MAEFRRSKSLSVELYRTRWSEEDFARLSKVIQKHTGKVAISIVSGDGEDLISTDDPEFFRSGEMPSSIRSVTMSVRDGVSCEVKVGFPEHEQWGSSEPAKASVSGAEDRAVSSLFRDLEKEFRARSLRGARLVRFFEGPGGLFVTFVASGTALISLYVMGASYLAEWLPWLRTTRSGTTLLIVGVGLMLALAVVLTGRAIRLITRSFPMIEFAGKLERSNRFQRAGMVWLIGFVLLPLIINLLSGVLLQFF
jgi:hypothetical protein